MVARMDGRRFVEHTADVSDERSSAFRDQQFCVLPLEDTLIEHAFKSLANLRGNILKRSGSDFSLTCYVHNELT